jgi:hypothetical protein
MVSLCSSSYVNIMKFCRATATKYYEQSGNNSQKFHCYALTEDFTSLEKLSQALQENDPLLKVKFFSY